MRSPQSDDDGVDRLLRQAGVRWRAGQPTPPPAPAPDVLTMRQRGFGLRRAGTWAVAVAGIATVVAAVAVPLALQRTTDSGGLSEPVRPGAAFSALPPDSGSGVPVEGRGTLYRDGGGPIMLCDEVIATADLPTSSAGCSSLAVATVGVDPALLTTVTTKGQAFSEPVRVEGSYRAGVLTVTSVVRTPAEKSAPFVEPPIPCPAPAGGWGLGYGISGAEHESAINQLAAAVQANPGRYTQLWEGHPDGPASGADSATHSRMVYVVGVTGDVAKARVELAAIYPGNLCVYQVRHANADLEQIAARLGGASSATIRAEVDVMANKVRVKVVALDPRTNGLLDQVDRAALIIDEPMLMWLD